MEFFEDDPEEDEEMKDIIENVLDLYNDMNGMSFEELVKSSSAYHMEYKKILKMFEDYFDRELFCSETPQILADLIKEAKEPGMLMGPTRIKRVEWGIRKISRKFKIELPEKKLELKEGETKYSSVIVNANQSLSNEINITNEIKIEVNQAIRDFEEEINKPNPDSSKIKILFEKIKKGAGYATIKAIEILLKKYCGI